MKAIYNKKKVEVLNIITEKNKFCDVTGGNHYAINDFGDPDDNTLFEITKEQLNQLTSK